MNWKNVHMYKPNTKFESNPLYSLVLIGNFCLEKNKLGHFFP